MYKIPANTLFMGKKLVFVPDCHSTNSLALELTQKNDLPEGSVVITHNQKQGRGQQGNAWISEPGKNLTFSIVVKPTFLAIKDQFQLNMVVSLAIRDVIKAMIDQPVYVKWPNDVIIDDCKVCGILIENQIQGSVFSNSIIGIGLNVNQRAFYAKQASSLTMISGKTYDLQTVFDLTLLKLEHWYLMLRKGAKERIKEAYLSSLYGVNEIRNFRTSRGQFAGTIEGIDESGRLGINTKNETKYFNSKEVQFDFEPLK